MIVKRNRSFDGISQRNKDLYIWKIVLNTLGHVRIGGISNRPLPDYSTFVEIFFVGLYPFRLEFRFLGLLYQRPDIIKKTDFLFSGETNLRMRLYHFGQPGRSALSHPDSDKIRCKFTIFKSHHSPTKMD